jgi:Zn-dependent protease
MTGTLFEILALAPALVFAIVFHEVAHGWTALALGDPTARERHRLSLNPLRHVDPIGTLVLPGVLLLAGAPAFGWAKPVPVIQQRLRNPRFGMMAVAAAGPLTNLAMAVLGAVAVGLLVRGGNPPEASVGGYLLLALTFFMLINVFLAFFNLLPIPPFDGSHIVEGVLPPSWASVYRRLRPLGIVLFLGLVALSWYGPTSGILTHLIGPPVEWMLGRLDAIARAVSGGNSIPAY